MPPEHDLVAEAAEALGGIASWSRTPETADRELATTDIDADPSAIDLNLMSSWRWQGGVPGEMQAPGGAACGHHVPRRASRWPIDPVQPARAAPQDSQDLPGGRRHGVTVNSIHGG